MMMNLPSYVGRSPLDLSSFSPMAAGKLLCALLLLFVFFGPSVCGFYSSKSHCRSWMYIEEVHDLRDWRVPSECEKFVARYEGRGQHRKDSQAVVKTAFEYAKKLTVQKNGKDIWIFDIDETALSNLGYFELHRYGAEPIDTDAFKAWVEKGEDPALRWSLALYNKLKAIGITPFFITGRPESQRMITTKNLLAVGYSDWGQLIMRQKEDVGDDLAMFKSAKRKALEAAGYHIVGNIGDQWTDISGFSMGDRTFKLPNPLYYVG